MSLSFLLPLISAPLRSRHGILPHVVLGSVIVVFRHLRIVVICRSLADLYHLPSLMIWFSLWIGSNPLIWRSCNRWDEGFSTPIVSLPPIFPVVITMWRPVEGNIWPPVELRLRLRFFLLNLEFLQSLSSFLVEHSTAPWA